MINPTTIWLRDILISNRMEDQAQINISLEKSLKNKIAKILVLSCVSIILSISAFMIVILHVEFEAGSKAASAKTLTELEIDKVGIVSVTEIAPRLTQNDPVIAMIPRLKMTEDVASNRVGDNLAYDEAIDKLQNTYHIQAKAYGYDPFNADDDRDGVSDYLEVAEGIDPTDPYTIDANRAYTDGEASMLGIALGDKLNDGEILINDKSFPASQHDSVFVAEGGVVNTAGCELRFIAQSSTNTYYDLGSTVTDENGLFYFVNTRYVPNGEYLIYGYCVDAIGKVKFSKGHKIVIGSPDDLDLPINIWGFSGIKFEDELRSLLANGNTYSNKLVSSSFAPLLMTNSLRPAYESIIGATLSEQLKSGGIKLQNPYNVQIYEIPFNGDLFVLGSIKPNIRVQAYWNSSMQINRIVSNSSNGGFYLTPNESLEIGKHKLMIYAYDPGNPELKSSPVVIEFNIHTVKEDPIKVILTLISGLLIALAIRRKFWRK